MIEGVFVYIQHMQGNGVKLDEEHWHEHVPKLVETNQEDKVTIFWNQQVKTHRSIPNKKPDITMHDDEKGTCMLIDIAISGDRNVLWNHKVHTNREVMANRPDVIIKNKKEKTYILIDVAIPAERNAMQKEAENKLKYKRYNECGT
jgi:hypothetical protein